MLFDIIEVAWTVLDLPNYRMCNTRAEIVRRGVIFILPLKLNYPLPLYPWASLWSFEINPKIACSLFSSVLLYSFLQFNTLVIVFAGCLCSLPPNNLFLQSRGPWSTSQGMFYSVSLHWSSATSGSSQTPHEILCYFPSLVLSVAVSVCNNNTTLLQFTPRSTVKLKMA